MKIVSWNASMRFRDKCVDVSEEFDADIYVICECENPAKSKSKKYNEFATNYVWIGENKNKGLGIFAKDGIKLEKLEKYSCEDLKYFIPVLVDDKFKLLGVWAMEPYVEILHDYYNANKELFDENLIMCGDFNSDFKLDYHHPKNKNFESFVNILEEDDLVDAYHDKNKDEEWGKELNATFFQTKKLNYRFHLDHVFSAPGIVDEFDIIDNVKWIKLSDHLPLVFTIDESKF
ncbi:endonuclease/exonuclease/phosphatase family protein [uncultured Methanobrevibacter sp.]|uniref:endonuclease/exonuclease/phosphatase family protein n=1 Tax=uncultured Methanobrevibacter sp. TaxID=253161 RepID=UPI00260EC25C